jgi:glycosyltransferase involved in cell wall biosynthesis
MDLNNKKLIVVLGMHRSGTSTITRALMTMGVELGDRLMPPVDGNNSKGFWEDIDINALNIEMLKFLNSDWHYLSSISSADVVVLKQNGFLDKATILLSKKIHDKSIFGFKDPRVTKLLPFWREVFEYCNFDIKYVLVIRNPLSVAKSLQKRDGFSIFKGYLLWLAHVIESLSVLTDGSSILVDYDLLIKSPDQEIIRIAKHLKLNVSQDELLTFKNEFVDQTLRHTFFSIDDLKNDSLCPPIVTKTYDSLLNFAKYEKSIFQESIQKFISNLKIEFNTTRSESLLIDELYGQLECLSIKENDHINQIQHLNRSLDIKDQQNKILNHEAELRDQAINKLIKEVEARDQRINELNLEIQSNEKRINELNLEIQSNEKRINELNLEIQSNELKVEELNQLTIENSTTILSLQSSVESQNNQIIINQNMIVDLTNNIEKIKQSTSWVITKPLRFLSNILNWTKIKGKLELNEEVNTEISINNQLNELARDGYNVIDSSLQDANDLIAKSLPEDFNSEIYLKLNPDVAAVDIDPIIHYLHYGIGEGRSYSISPIEYNVSKKINPNLATILVVSHEASITGAPVLSLNLVKSFSEEYNVVSLLLGGGDLYEEFKLSSNAFKIQTNLRIKPEVADLIIEQLCNAFDFKFAVINSIESRDVLPSLNNRFVPTITLIHEFASYTRPKDAFEFTFNWSNEVVFSTEITLNNARSQCQLEEYKPLVLPQGRCLLPSNRYTEFEIQAEKNRLNELLKPSSLASDTILILGAGSVQLRKGVDLFIDCANRVVNVYNKTNCRFVWIGKGFDPVNDAFYSVYLADQIHRCGLDNFITFIDETYAIEAAYETADLFLMTSRLDPLPNVAIDAMTFGLPVLCFENTTGIANFFKDVELDKQCVLPYLDTEKMANAIINLVNNPDSIQLLGDQSKSEAIKYFDMNSYVTELGGIANHAIKKCNQLKDDINLIAESKLLRPDFYDPSYLKKGIESDSCEKIAKSYLRDWAKTKKPFPGFHPEIYKTEHGLNNTYSNPFADYLRRGQPEGSWKNKVIDNSEISMFSTKHYKVALHIHVFYPDLLKKIISALKLNQSLPDLYISFTNVVLLDELSEVLNSYDGKVIDIKPVPNLGRDIGPLLTLFGEAIAENYDYFGHIHTKKTRSLIDENVGEIWFDFLIENLIGGQSSGSMMDKILNTFFQDETIGMIFPDDPHIDPKIMSWNENIQFAEKLKLKLGIDELPLNFNFPVGTMFWANTSLLLPFINLGLDWSDYPNEPLGYNGTLLHALERLFPLALPKQFKIVTTNVFGITR